MLVKSVIKRFTTGAVTDVDDADSPGRANAVFTLSKV